MSLKNMHELINIGIVDDHHIYKKGLKLALSYYADLNVLLEADNGMDLLKKLSILEPDLLLLDLQMSVMDGITVLPHIKNEFPLVKVIILSIYDDHSIVSKMLELGADSYLSKSCEPAQMYYEIRKVMRNNLQLHY